MRRTREITERERERETETETERETERDRDRERQRQRDREDLLNSALHRHRCVRERSLPLVR